jgi:hypothetical protein
MTSGRTRSSKGYPTARDPRDLVSSASDQGNNRQRSGTRRRSGAVSVPARQKTGRPERSRCRTYKRANQKPARGASACGRDPRARTSPGADPRNRLRQFGTVEPALYVAIAGLGDSLVPVSTPTRSSGWHVVCTPSFGASLASSEAATETATRNGDTKRRQKRRHESIPRDRVKATEVHDQSDCYGCPRNRSGGPQRIRAVSVNECQW